MVHCICMDGTIAEGNCLNTERLIGVCYTPVTLSINTSMYWDGLLCIQQKLSIDHVMMHLSQLIIQNVWI